MNFTEAYQHHLNGKKVRRKSWADISQFLGKNYDFSESLDITADDAVANDWHVIEYFGEKNE